VGVFIYLVAGKIRKQIYRSRHNLWKADAQS